MAWLAVVLYALVIFFSSATPGEYVPDLFPGADKLLHFLEYLPFGFLVRRAIAKSFRGSHLLKPLLASFFVVVLYSLSDEIHQLFVAGRQFSYFDALVDSAGGLAGIVLYGASFLRWLK